MKKLTKKEIASLVRTTSDAFGHNFEIDTTSDYDCDFALIAFRESLKNTVSINLNGNKTIAYMNTASKKEFIECVFYAINKLRPEHDQAKQMINWAELSRTLAGDRSSITKDRIPEKHKEAIESLITSIADWFLTLRP